MIPNEADSFIVDEMKERLAQGLTVTIAFGGSSMLPMIDGRSDRIELAAVEGGLQRGEVYLFVYQGRCVIHRLIGIDGERLVFRGDNCRNTECVSRKDVLARLVAVDHSNGTREVCDSDEWRRKSRRVALRRTLINMPFNVFGLRQRRWQRWVYLALLLVLMWAPVNGLGLELDSYLLRIRLDHLLHASVYVPFVFFMMDLELGRRRWFVPHWLLGLLFAAVTESGQLLLFYRGFDPSDLVANFIGVSLGWFLLVCWKSKKR